jgi:hypothetical protein
LGKKQLAHSTDECNEGGAAETCLIRSQPIQQKCPGELLVLILLVLSWVNGLQMTRMRLKKGFEKTVVIRVFPFQQESSCNQHSRSKSLPISDLTLQSQSWALKERSSSVYQKTP